MGFKGFLLRAALPAAVFSFLLLVPEAYSADAERVVICHVRGPEPNSVVMIEVSAQSVPGHRSHGDRDPVGGVCASGTGGANTGSGNSGGGSGGSNTGSGTTGGQEMVTLCHSTGSATNPFMIETVTTPALQAHLAGGDLYPNGGTCPGIIGGDPTAPTPEPITMLLFGAGLAGVGYAARRRSHKKR